MWKYSQCKSVVFNISFATGHLKKKGEKYLIIDSTKEYEEVFPGIISEIKTINGGKELFHEKKLW